MTFILLSGKPPFMGDSKEDVYKAIKETTHQYQGKEWTKVTAQARNFLELCLDKNPNSRPSAEELLNHPWLTQVDHAKS